MKNQKKKLKTEKGITLIALVLTIIVLLILAGVTISALSGDNGILTQSAKAKENARGGEIKEIVDLAVSENEITKYGEGIRKDKAQVVQELSDKLTQEEKELLESQDVIQIGDIEIDFGKLNGVREWIIDGEIITNGKTELKMGDYVNYNPQEGATNAIYISMMEKTGWTDNQTFNLGEYTGGWRILGVEDGKIQLISSDTIAPGGTGKVDYYLKGIRIGGRYGVEELDNISKLYGQGKGAESARSVTVRDINKITGYDPENPVNGKPYKAGQICEYGNKVTYSLDENKYVKYEASNGLTGTSTSKAFSYFDEVTKSYKDLKENESKEIISTNYDYYPNTLTERSSGEIKGDVVKGTLAYDLLFTNTNSKYYWLGSDCVATYEGYARKVIQYVRAGGVFGNLVENVSNVSYGVRPTVNLKSEVQIEKKAGTAEEPHIIQVVHK